MNTDTVPSPFPIRGVAEAFYGVYYTPVERNDLIRFIGQHGFNTYLYGPKNDRQHRNRWREPYPAKTMQQFADTVAIARDSGVTFCYAIGPVVSMCYSDEADYHAIITKLEAFYRLGVRSFCAVLDDMKPEFLHEADRRCYNSYAEAHVHLCNRLFEWLQALDPACTFSLCPTLYYGRPPFDSYVYEIGMGLYPEIDVFYTGADICSPQITAADAAAFAQAIKRPPLIWDNYPVNDLGMQPEMHIGPVRGRGARLPTQTRGIVANLMLQAEASKIPLLTYAEYMRNPDGYDPDAAWERALYTVAGDDSAAALRLFAENSLQSCLDVLEAAKLDRLTEAAYAALRGGERASDSPAVAALDAYLTAVDEALYHLKYRMDNLALRNNLLPWIELLEAWGWSVRYGFGVLRKIEQGVPFDDPLWRMKEYWALAKNHYKRVAGKIVVPLVEYMLDIIAQAEKETR
ncbi:MAG: beta-N-acetylglucosaminidase domain-containing protein [Chloroflexi bacterium]|nr:beta-N-acetylglucosaminidase domain-containing protein [Chloroflexota bacterium]